MSDEALSKLSAWDGRQATGGTPLFWRAFVEEAAQALGVSERTVKRDWMMARAWLSAVLNGRDGDAPPR